MNRLIIVSNRLPIKVIEKEGSLYFEKSSGGLATGLRTLSTSMKRVWVGWPGYYPNNSQQEKQLSKLLGKHSIVPVYLTQEDIDRYYEGFCNSTLWPLFHYFSTYTDYNALYWEAYKKVNEQFCKKILEISTKDDIIWIHDYHLMLLPGMLREQLPDNQIGYFLHIPFPSFELFRNLKNRKELLLGILGSNLVGFHIFDYMRHFMESVYRILGYESDNNHFFIQNRYIGVDAFPMGINFNNFYKSSAQVKTAAKIVEFTEMFKNQKVILCVDRLDYSKGILNRLKALEIFFAENPQYLSKVIIYMLMVPSRDNVEQYHELKVKIDETIGSINGRYSKHDWIPIHYYYQSYPFNDLAALYNISDIALVTPLRDGMNLVAKEYIAAKERKKGVLILSEMAGAAIELNNALQVNPNNIEEIAKAIKTAMEMPDAEKVQRMKIMQNYVRSQHVGKWAKNFLKSLKSIFEKQQVFKKKLIMPEDGIFIKNAFNSSKEKLILLDYDGTLTPYNSNPMKVAPDKKTYQCIKELVDSKKADVFIISGRNRAYLDKIFKNINIKLIAEHGAYFKLEGKWEKVFVSDNEWKHEILEIMKESEDKTPGAFIEEKDTAIVWHFRKVNRWLADLRVNQLMTNLIYPCTKLRLHLTKGEKIIEVTLKDYTKGSAAMRLLNIKNYDFILAAGDDVTDIEMMQSLPENAITIKIGKPTDYSKYHIESQNDFIKLLESLVH